MLSKYFKSQSLQQIPFQKYKIFGTECNSFQGFFCKFLMGGLQIFGPRLSPTGRSQMGGGTCEKNPTEAKTAHLMQN